MVASELLSMEVDVYWEYDLVYEGTLSDFMIDYGYRSDLMGHLGLLEEHDEVILDLEDGVWRIVMAVG